MKGSKEEKRLPSGDACRKIKGLRGCESAGLKQDPGVRDPASGSHESRFMGRSSEEKFFRGLAGGREVEREMVVRMQEPLQKLMFIRHKERSHEVR